MTDRPPSVPGEANARQPLFFSIDDGPVLTCPGGGWLVDWGRSNGRHEKTTKKKKTCHYSQVSKTGTPSSTPSRSAQTRPEASARSLGLPCQDQARAWLAPSRPSMLLATPIHYVYKPLPSAWPDARWRPRPRIMKRCELVAAGLQPSAEKHLQL